MFDAIVNRRIDLEGLELVPHLADVESLNAAALAGQAQITKLSYHAYAYVAQRYVLLDAGSALGNNCGPILISNRAISPQQVAAGDLRIAIPGKYTTANFLLGIAFPAARNKFELVFSEIEGALLRDEYDAGLIIHENRFTYEDKGLRKIVDLGEWWAERTDGLPLPLGGNIIRRDLGPEMIAKVSKMLHDSIAYALSHREAAVEYALQYGRGLDRARTDRFVGMYVNDLTLSYGDRGRRGVERLLTDAYEQGLIPQRVPIEFAGEPLSTK